MEKTTENTVIIYTCSLQICDFKLHAHPYDCHTYKLTTWYFHGFLQETIKYFLDFESITCVKSFITQLIFYGVFSKIAYGSNLLL